MLEMSALEYFRIALGVDLPNDECITHSTMIALLTKRQKTALSSRSIKKMAIGQVVEQKRHAIWVLSDETL